MLQGPLYSHCRNGSGIRVYTLQNDVMFTSLSVTVWQQYPTVIKWSWHSTYIGSLAYRSAGQISWFSHCIVACTQRIMLTLCHYKHENIISSVQEQQCMCAFAAYKLAFYIFENFCCPIQKCYHLISGENVSILQLSSIKSGSC